MDNNTNTGIILTGIAIIVLVVIGYALYRAMQPTTGGTVPTTSPTTTNNMRGTTTPIGTTTPTGTSTFPTTSTTTSAVNSNGRMVTVEYTSNGFSPARVTVSPGDTVTFVQRSGAPSMWVATDPHPAHTGYDSTSLTVHCAQNYTGARPFDQCTSGQRFSFTFEKRGSWAYHNHSRDVDRGTIVVQ